MKERIEEIIKEKEEECFSKTIKKFPKHLELINFQQNVFLDFLINKQMGDIELLVDGNAYEIIRALLADSIKKSQVCKKLLMWGYYSETAALLRIILENMSHMIYISKNPDKWKEWFEYNRYKMSQLMDETTTRPKTIFSHTKRILDGIGMSEFYKHFRILCRYSHTTSEIMKDNYTFDNDKLFLWYHYAPRFIEDKSEYLLNMLFGFINESIWRGFNDAVTFKTIPKRMKEYKKIQESASKIFDKFYE